MHLVFFLRGVPQQVALWKVLAQGQWFKFRRIELKTKEKQEVLIQGGLRDSVMGTMEYIFPKEALPTVLSIFGIKEGDVGCEKKWTHSVRLAGLRKMLGLKKIPHKAFIDAEKKGAAPTVMFDDFERGLSDFRQARVSIHPIGIKYDKIGAIVNPNTDEGYFQELV